MTSTSDPTKTVQIYRVYINATPQAIWDAITQPEFTEKYGYGGRGEYELRPGGSYRGWTSEEMRQQGAPDLAIDGEVIEVDPPRKLVLTWRMMMDEEMAAEGFTRLTYEIEERTGGLTKLTVIHDLTGTTRLGPLMAGELEDGGAGGGWTFVLSGLKTLLETGKPMPGYEARRSGDRRAALGGPSVGSRRAADDRRPVSGGSSPAGRHVRSRRTGPSRDSRKAAAASVEPEYCRPMALPPPARHLLRAKDVIDTRYHEPLDVAELARAVHLSPAHFSREFRRVFGETPYQYLLTRRLERAATLLRTTDRSIADVCLTVGLTSIGSFTTSFGRAFGLSPTAYRAAHPPAADRALVPSCVVRAYGRPQAGRVHAHRPLPPARDVRDSSSGEDTRQRPE